MTNGLWRGSGLGLALGSLLACGPSQPPAASSVAPPPSSVRPSILLVTMDTTRADAIGPDAVGVQTPAFNALAARGMRFRQAYATVPETLPSHASMMTGLYPGGHGIHENARVLPTTTAVVAEQLQKAGYRTSAFVSSFALARRFGLARGFDRYDDEPPAGRQERTARETSDAVLAELAGASDRPRFVWVHFYDPHAPYAPPEPYRTRYPKSPYLGEIAAMDEQIGRLVQAFEQSAPAGAVIVVADHGEGLGDHGEALHGNLVYQSTMHVPLVVVGAGLASGVNDTPVSTRRVYHTILDLAGLAAEHSLRRPDPEVVLGEGMKPFLEYGWQPQVMAVEGTRKAILSGTVEAYDLDRDPKETRSLGSGVNLTSTLRGRLEEYPVPSPDVARAPDALDDDAKRRLASLGYVSAGAAPTVRRDAPRPADMTTLFADLERASAVFTSGDYAAAIPILTRILAADPTNLDATLRLATAHSSLGHDVLAIGWFKKAGALAPRSVDVKTYLALHYARGRDWALAAPLLEQVVAQSPERVPALEGLAVVRERQGRVADAVALRQQIYRLRTPSVGELVQLGQLAMAAQQTQPAIEAFEAARARVPDAFTRHLELGVLYLAARRVQEAATALDRVPASSPDYAMALFKRAQASVLLGESDQAARIDAARRHADATTKVLIEREQLFAGK
ncbi:MAG: sulfatase-like hydrolase/transferase [Vicinamibacterales bacterium]